VACALPCKRVAKARCTRRVAFTTCVLDLRSASGITLRTCSLMSCRRCITSTAGSFGVVSAAAAVRARPTPPRHRTRTPSHCQRPTHCALLLSDGPTRARAAPLLTSQAHAIRCPCCARTYDVRRMTPVQDVKWNAVTLQQRVPRQEWGRGGENGNPRPYRVSHRSEGWWGAGRIADTGL
jgi:hypothetical protein